MCNENLEFGKIVRRNSYICHFHRYTIDKKSVNKGFGAHCSSFSFNYSERWKQSNRSRADPIVMKRTIEFADYRKGAFSLVYLNSQDWTHSRNWIDSMIHLRSLLWSENYSKDKTLERVTFLCVFICHDLNECPEKVLYQKDLICRKKK